MSQKYFFDYITRMIKEYFWNITEMLLEYFWEYRAKIFFAKCLKNIQKIFCSRILQVYEYFNNIFVNNAKTFVRNITEIFWEYYKNIVAKLCWNILGILLECSRNIAGIF